MTAPILVAAVLLMGEGALLFWRARRLKAKLRRLRQDDPADYAAPEDPFYGES